LGKYFTTNYRSLATEFEHDKEVLPCRMAIDVDNPLRDIPLYKHEEGVAEGNFGMHCAAKCGIEKRIIYRVEVVAKEFEHTIRLKHSLEVARAGT
jgi:DNA mismatch repair protein MSH6